MLILSILVLVLVLFSLMKAIRERMKDYEPSPAFLHIPSDYKEDYLFMPFMESIDVFWRKDEILEKKSIVKERVFSKKWSELTQITRNQYTCYECSYLEGDVVYSYYIGTVGTGSMDGQTACFIILGLGDWIDDFVSKINVHNRRHSIDKGNYPCISEGLSNFFKILEEDPLQSVLASKRGIIVPQQNWSYYQVAIEQNDHPNLNYDEFMQYVETQWIDKVIAQGLKIAEEKSKHEKKQIDKEKTQLANYFIRRALLDVLGFRLYNN